MSSYHLELWHITIQFSGSPEHLNLVVGDNQGLVIIRCHRRYGIYTEPIKAYWNCQDMGLTKDAF